MRRRAQSRRLLLWLVGWLSPAAPRYACASGDFDIRAAARNSVIPNPETRDVLLPTPPPAAADEAAYGSARDLLDDAQVSAVVILVRAPPVARRAGLVVFTRARLQATDGVWKAFTSIEVCMPAA